MAAKKTLNEQIQEHSAKVKKLQDQLAELLVKGKDLQQKMFKEISEQLALDETVYVSALFNGWSYAGKVVEINRRAGKIQWANGEVTPFNLDAIQMILDENNYKRHLELEDTRDALFAQGENAPEEEERVKYKEQHKALLYINQEALKAI